MRLKLCASPRVVSNCREEFPKEMFLAIRQHVGVVLAKCNPIFKWDFLNVIARGLKYWYCALKFYIPFLNINQALITVLSLQNYLGYVQGYEGILLKETLEVRGYVRIASGLLSIC